MEPSSLPAIVCFWNHLMSRWRTFHHNRQTQLSERAIIQIKPGATIQLFKYPMGFLRMHIPFPLSFFFPPFFSQAILAFAAHQINSSEGLFLTPKYLEFKGKHINYLFTYHPEEKNGELPFLQMQMFFVLFVLFFSFFSEV